MTPTGTQCWSLQLADWALDLPGATQPYGVEFQAAEPAEPQQELRGKRLMVPT